MFPNKDKVNRITSIEDLFTSGMTKSESDVVDDMFLAIQNIIAGTAVVSKTKLSETSYQYKINLCDDFPEITIQYKLKSMNKDTMHMIPVVEYKETGNNVKQEIPELLSVLIKIEDVKDEELVSIDSPKGKKSTTTLTEMNDCSKSTFDSVQSSISLYNLLKNKGDTGKKPFKCEECGKCFSWISHLKLHEITHTGEEPFKCEICNRSFIQNSALIDHKKIHMGDTPFKCVECGKCFTQIGSFKLHQKYHSDRPFKCEKCGKCFVCSAQLILHETIHTGEKPFKCEECGKCFTQIRSFKLHQKCHSDRPFKCAECGKCFVCSAQLILHKTIHTGEKPFKCKKCGKYTSQLCNLKTQIQINLCTCKTF